MYGLMYCLKFGNHVISNTSRRHNWENAWRTAELLKKSLQRLMQLHFIFPRKPAQIFNSIAYSFLYKSVLWILFMMFYEVTIYFFIQTNLWSKNVLNCWIKKIFWEGKRNICRTRKTVFNYCFIHLPCYRAFLLCFSKCSNFDSKGKYNKMPFI